jgi:RNA polymerase sigma factor (sigma-70 family)
MLLNYYRSLEQEHILPPSQLSTPTESDDSRIAVLLDNIPTTEPERSTEPAQLQQVQELTTEGESVSGTEELLERYNPYIVALVEKMALLNSSLARPEVLGLVIEEIAQNVRIKLWRTLQEKPIEHHKAYIRAITRNEFTEMLRKRKASMPIDESSELYVDDSTVRRTMADPADELEEEERFHEWLDCVASAISALPARQQQAMICVLNEQIGTRTQLIQAFKKHRIDIQTVIWPEDEADKRLLKASITAARHKIARSLGVDLMTYKANSIAERALPSSELRDQFENGNAEGEASRYENGSAPRKPSFFRY